MVPAEKAENLLMTGYPPDSSQRQLRNGMLKETKELMRENRLSTKTFWHAFKMETAALHVRSVYV